MYPFLSAKNFIFIDFFAVKVDGSDVNPGICENALQFLQLHTITRYITIFSGESKDYKYVKFPQTL